jgi:hypothetical protein
MESSIDEWMDGYIDGWTNGFIYAQYLYCVCMTYGMTVNMKVVVVAVSFQWSSI